MKKRGLICIVLIALMASLTITACSKPPEQIKEGPETGVYYNDSAGYENLITLHNGDKFVFWVEDENRSGTYTLSEETLTLTFNKVEGKPEQEKLTASISNEVITLTYSGADMRFLKKKTLTVSFDSKGGSVVAPLPVLIGRSLSKPADPTRAGYIFIGWYTDSNFTAEFKFDSQVITENITLYAYWAPEAPGATEFTIGFDQNYQDAPEISSTETIGGKIYKTPSPERDGYNFEGWWVSMYNDGSRLSYPLSSETTFKENTTLYAFWQSTSSIAPKLAAPIVRIDGDAVRWDGVQGAISYRLEISGPAGFTAIDESVGPVFRNVPFSTSPAGDYEIKVTAVSSNSDNNSAKTIIYYRNKALARVSHFDIIEPSVLVFGKVANATNYLITVDCGDAQHNQSHTALDLGNNNLYNFANCSMGAEGIKFVVTAQADGYASSESLEYVFDRRLPEINGLYMDEATQTLWWSSVREATNYIVSVECGDASHSHLNYNNGNKTSYSLKNCAPKSGGIKISVYPAAKGYNSPAPTEYTYNKTNIASPGDIRLDGKYLKWTAVGGAASYVIRIAGQNDFTSDTNSFEIPDGIEFVAGQEYAVVIMAKGATDSLWSDTFLICTTISGLYYEYNTISWEYVIGAEKYEVRLNGGTPIEVAGNENQAQITLDQAGNNLIEVRFFDGTSFSTWVGIRVVAYTLTLDTQGGENPETQYLANGDRVNITDASRDGYDFVGWFLSPESNASRYSDIVFDGSNNLTIYAKWTARAYAVTYDYQGKDDGGVLNADVSFGEHFKFEAPENNTDDGTSFVGWYSAPDGNGTRLTDEFGNSINLWNVAGDTTVYAFWGNVLRYVFLESNGTYSAVKGLHIPLVTTVTVPELYNGQRVTVVDSFAFLNCTRLVSISIPDVVELVEATAFDGCISLLNVEIYHVENHRDINYSSIDGVLYKILGENPETGVEELQLANYPMAKPDAFVIPANVTSIGNLIFADRTGLTSITIPSTVTSIGLGAFRNCTSLREVIFAEGAMLTELRQDLFFNCTSLVSINLPSTVTLIGNNAFRGCISLESIEISKNVTSMGTYAFAGCRSLKTVTFEKGGQEALIIGPDTLTETVATAAYVFQNCISLESIEIPGRTTIIGNYAFTGCSNLKTLTFEFGSEIPLVIGTGLANGNTNTGVFQNCVSLIEVEIPNRVKYLGGYSFSGCKNLEILTFEPDGLAMTVGQYAFQNCAIKAVVIPKSITTLNFRSVFAGCNDLNDFAVEDGHTAFNIIDGIVFNAAATQVMYCPAGKTGTYTIPDTVTTINSYAFRDCVRLEGIVIPKSVTTVGSNAFFGCTRLTTVTFEKGGTEDLKINDYAFAFCNKLITLEFPSRTIELGGNMFRDAVSLTTVTFEEPGEDEEERPLYIGMSFFYNCTGLVSVSFPERIAEKTATTKTLPMSMFHNSGIKEIYLPKSIKSINDMAFNYTNYLENFYVHEDNEYFSTIDGVLYNKDQTTLIRYTSGKSTTYVIPDGVKAVHNYAFAYDQSTTDVTFANTVESIGNNAFYNSSALKNLIFAPGGTADLSIGNSAFYAGSTRPVLESIELPARLKSIGSSAFIYHRALKSVTFAPGSRLEDIGSSAFQRTIISEIEIPASVKTIANGAFGSSEVINETLKSVTFEAGSQLEVLGDNVFKSCVGLTEMVLPASLKTLGVLSGTGGVFRDCINLTSVEFEAGSSLETIGNYSFYGSGLAELILPDALKTIGNYAFYKNKITGTLTIPASVEVINNTAFSDCKEITGLVFELENSALTTIGSSAFANCENLTGGITIPKSVVTINSNAFQNCYSLQAVAYETGSLLETLGSGTFSGCSSISSINIPNGINVTSGHFSNCNSLTEIILDQDGSNSTTVDGVLFNLAKTSILVYPRSKAGPYTIPDSITNIGTVFNNCSEITELNIHAGVTIIGTATSTANALTGTSKLTAINVHADNPNFSSENGILYNKDKSTLLYYPGGKTGAFTIPESVTSIGPSAFYGVKNLEKIEITKNIISIGANAFNSSSMTAITFEEGALIKTIGGNAFSGLTNVTEIEIPYGVETLSNSAFANSLRFDGSLKRVVIPDSVTSMGTYMFSYQYKLESIVMPKNLTLISSSMFQYCTSLTSITIPDNVTLIDMNAFRDCTSLTNLKIPTSVTMIANYALQNCTSLTSLTIPDSVTSLGPGVFSGSGLTEITLPTSISEMGASAFQNCTSLVSVTLSPRLISILASTFSGCTALKNIEIPGSVEEIGSSAFINCTALESIEIPYGVEALGAGDYTSNGVFENCTSLKKVTLPLSLTLIRGYTFYNCTSLNEIIIPDSITSIGNYAFWGCASLTEMNIHSDIVSVGNYAFYNCTSLERVTIGAGVTSLGSSVFAGCNSIASLVIPASVQTIGDDAFTDWTAEQKIYVIELSSRQSNWGLNWDRYCEAEIIWEWQEQRA